MNPYGFLVVKQAEKLKEGRNPGGSNAKRGMSIKGERIGEQRTGGDILERGNFAGEKNKSFGSHHLHTRIIFGGDSERLARDHRYASLALRLAKDHSESRRSGGSGEGPKLATALGLEPIISGFIRGSSLNLSWDLRLRIPVGLLIEIDLGSELGSGLEIDWTRLEDRWAPGLAIAITGNTLHDSTTPPPPPVQLAPQAGAFVLHGQTETTPYSVVAPAQIVDDTHALAALLVEFRMPDIERYTGIGCPVFTCSYRALTWADLGQEFIRQYSFNTIVDVSRRELEALRQGPDETITSFISCWREKIRQIIDRPSERDQISMIMHSLQPRFARHLMGFPQTDFGSLVQALYGIEEGISRGLWADSSPSNSKGKKSGSGPRPSDVGTIGMTGHRSSRRPPFQS
ncbi:hypothetical protein CK203_064338 [Vitis vinifera]|uniref:Retrotransposon gag domain-containing protein n=1 Tax=Vitis vinifera TaxID=29760 RepID=A0A438GWG7_VITVI|nr:hypothetical protein CK203_064338 [Vitis vinifera]